MQIRMTTIIVLFLSLHFIIGCVTATHTVTTKQSVSKDSDPLKAGKIISLKPEDGQIIVFDQDGGSYDATQKAVIGMTEEQQDVVIPLDQVRELRFETQTEEVDVGAVVTGTAVVALLGAAGFLIYVVSTFALAPV